MKNLFIIMGKSGSGKDTLVNSLLSDKEISNKLYNIIPYTTREKRENEEDGKEYHFTTKKELKTLINKGLVAEKRWYKKANEGYVCYATILANLREDNYITINTPDGALSIIKHLKNDNVNVIPIYLNVDDMVIIESMLQREKNQKEPSVIECCRRFIRDKTVEYDTKGILNDIPNLKVFTIQNEQERNERMFVMVKTFINKIISEEDE